MISSESKAFDLYVDVKDFLEKLRSREEHKLPSANDIEGAAHGLVRLYSLYQFDVQKFSEEGIVSTTLDNGQVVYSEPSLLPVVCKYKLNPHSQPTALFS